MSGGWFQSRDVQAHVVGLAVLIVLPLLFRDAFSLGIITLTLFWASAASAWNISGGFAGQLSLGHSAFLGIGAYTSTLLFLKCGLSPWLGMLAGAALAAFAAFVLGAVTMRLKGSFFVMATLAFGAVMHISAVTWRDLTQGTAGLVIPLTPSVGHFVFQDKLVYAYIALGMMIINYVTARAIAASKMGFALIAYRENDEAARALGIRTLRMRLLAFMLSAALTAVCGTFHAQYFLYIDPDGVFSLAFALQVALLAIVGGLGTATGPLLGALIITPLGLFLQATFGNAVSGLHLVVYASIVIVVLLSVPEGLGPALTARFARKKL